jgi:hypothetical protein
VAGGVSVGRVPLAAGILGPLLVPVFGFELGFRLKAAMLGRDVLALFVRERVRLEELPLMAFAGFPVAEPSRRIVAGLDLVEAVFPAGFVERSPLGRALCGQG